MAHHVWVFLTMGPLDPCPHHGCSWVCMLTRGRTMHGESGSDPWPHPKPSLDGLLATSPGSVQRVESPSLSLLLNYACSSATDMETLKENPGDVSITLPGSSMTTT